tara:strand:+ start:180 stop:1382 length:1203 start_codon:yes stop_codon:yes gene_type:complete
MAFILQDKETIKQSLATDFQLAGFTNLVPGTPEFALWTILTDNFYELYSTMYESYKQTLPFEAHGTDLDAWSSFFGNPRILSTYTQDLSLTNVYFYLPTGTDRQSVYAGDIVIPVGTRISANGVNKFFVTTTERTMGAADSIVYVPVMAEQSGAGSNISAGELNTHDLSEKTAPSYIAGIAPLLFVTNKSSITTGQYPQNDFDLRENIQDTFGKRMGTNHQAIRDAVLDLPGVAVANILPGARGTGTFVVFIDSTAPVVSLNLITQVQAVINGIQALGVRGYIEYPDYKGVQVRFEITFKSGLNKVESLLTVETETRELVVNFINNLNRGAELDPNLLLRFILDNPLVLSATIQEFAIGDYYIDDEEIHNREVVLATKKQIKGTEKWLSSSLLITYCSVA